MKRTVTYKLKSVDFKPDAPTPWAGSIRWFAAKETPTGRALRWCGHGHETRDQAVACGKILVTVGARE